MSKYHASDRRLTNPQGWVLLCKVSEKTQRTIGWSNLMYSGYFALISQAVVPKGPYTTVMESYQY